MPDRAWFVGLGEGNTAPLSPEIDVSWIEDPTAGCLLFCLDPVPCYLQLGPWLPGAYIFMYGSLESGSWDVGPCTGTALFQHQMFLVPVRVGLRSQDVSKPGCGTRRWLSLRSLPSLFVVQTSMYGKLYALCCRLACVYQYWGSATTNVLHAVLWGRVFSVFSSKWTLWENTRESNYNQSFKTSWQNHCNKVFKWRCLLLLRSFSLEIFSWSHKISLKPLILQLSSYHQ